MLLKSCIFFAQVGYGGGAACATVCQAAMAVATGMADVVVCYRAMNERSGRRFGRVSVGATIAPTLSGIDNGWHYPMGLSTPAGSSSMPEQSEARPAWSAYRVRSLPDRGEPG